VPSKISESFKASQVAVTTAATLVVPGASGRDTVLLYNIGSVTAYLGANTNVTTANGFPLDPRASITMEATADIYAIGASATTLAVLQEG
jgi:hypothetical protein